LQSASNAMTGEGGSSSFVMGITHAVGRLKNFGGIFSYLTSRWALTTFFVVRMVQAFGLVLSFLDSDLRAGNPPQPDTILCLVP
jgi:hypothetical protein